MVFLLFPLIAADKSSGEHGLCRSRLADQHQAAVSGQCDNASLDERVISEIFFLDLIRLSFDI